MARSNGSEGMEDLRAFLGEGTEFKGVLSFTETVRIDGRFEGEVISKDTLIIGETAVLNADVSVGTLIAKGEIRGNITATTKIEIRTESKIIGNIKTAVLVIEEGALFEGQCEMITKNGKGISSSYTSEREEEDMLVEDDTAIPV